MFFYVRVHWDRGMLVFNLRHMHTLAWKTNMVVFSIIYSRVSRWAFSLQKQMQAEQRCTCCLWRKCKEPTFRGQFYRERSWTDALHHASQIISVYVFLCTNGAWHPSARDDATTQLFLTLPGRTHENHTHTHARARTTKPTHVLPLLPHFSFNPLHVLFYFTLHLQPPPTLGPIWCPFLLCGPHNTTKPAYGLHIPLPVAAQI